MKKQFTGFLAGVVVTTLIGSLGVSALAATGALTIEVNPINVQVNGETFQPKDAKGNSVPVFAYNGTTYAPLRALAEAYGLEVGYDKGSNMATVGEKGSAPATTPTPDTTVSADYSDWTAEEEKAYQEFKGMWRIEERPNVDTGNYAITPIFAHYDSDKTNKGFADFVSSVGKDTVQKYAARMGGEFYFTNAVIRLVLFDGANWKIEIYFWNGIGNPSFKWADDMN